MTAWWEWVASVAGGAQDEAIARTVAANAGSKLSGSTVYRWRTGGVIPKPETVIDVARAYDAPVTAALAAAGFITDDEAGVTTIRRVNADPSDAELLEIIARRLNVSDPPASLHVITTADAAKRSGETGFEGEGG